MSLASASMILAAIATGKLVLIGIFLAARHGGGSQQPPGAS
jgi:hypothetical protein